MSVADTSILHDAVLRMKSLLASGIADPLSRTGNGVNFIMTAYPERLVNYPFITLKANLGDSTRMGAYSEMLYFPINFEIDVWTKKTRDRDCLSGSIFHLLRTSQFGVDAAIGSSTNEEHLYDFNLIGMTDLDEPGKDGIHRKIINIRYRYCTQG